MNHNKYKLSVNKLFLKSCSRLLCTEHSHCYSQALTFSNFTPPPDLTPRFSPSVTPAKIPPVVASSAETEMSHPQISCSPSPTSKVAEVRIFPISVCSFPHQDSKQKLNPS